MVESISFSTKSKSFVNYTDDGPLSYDTGAGSGRTACIQANRPFSISDGDVVYFEITVMSKSSRPATIGLGPRGFFRTGKHPGTAPNSYGWDGLAVKADCQETSLPLQWSEGDTIGCGWEPEKRVVFFTHNGVRLPKEATTDPSATLFATLSFSGNDTFLANFGMEGFPSFMYNLGSSSGASAVRTQSSTPSASTPLARKKITTPSGREVGSRGPMTLPDGRLVVHLAPQEYVHVKDHNAHLIHVVTGPLTLTIAQHESLIHGPSSMIVIPPQHYCQISDPVVRGKDGEAKLGPNGYDVLHGDVEIKFAQPPFPLYPGEVLTIAPKALPVIHAGESCILKAKCNFTDKINGKDVDRIAGEVWQVVGPCTLTPRKEVVIKPSNKGHVIGANEALVCRCTNDGVDGLGQSRIAGETYLVRQSGTYLPSPYESVIERRPGQILSPTLAVHLRAQIGFTDVYNKKRTAGSEWVLTHEDAEMHIPDVYETVVKLVPLCVLSHNQYCIVTDPVGKDGIPRLGERELRKGPGQFFLQPGESIEAGIQEVNVLGSDDALLLRARTAFTESDGTRRIAGERWLIRGPIEVSPDVNVDVIETRKMMAFERSEGVYVLNRATGQVRSVVGQVYMLGPEEEYWNKELPPKVEEWIQTANGVKREKYQVATVRVPHNCAVRVFSTNASERVCFGPDLVMLEPYEEVQLISLSAGHPKVPNTIQTLCLRLGPDFMADTFSVDTSDHARLNLRLAYSWRFEVDKTDPKKSSALFCVNDFVGDACRTIAGKVRAAVSKVTFDEFHKHSAAIIGECVLGKEGKPLKFEANQFTVTDVDVQRVEPSNADMQKALSTSVQQAIEITTKATEMRARQEGEMDEQLANGRLVQQKLKDDGAAEQERMRLLHTLAEGAALRSTGVAMAEAKAKAEAARIEGESHVELAKLRAEALRITHEAELARAKALHEAELEHLAKANELEVNLKKELAAVQKTKFATVVNSLGTDTIAQIASSKRRTQHTLLQGLGIRQMIFAGENQALNIFGHRGGESMAQRLVGPPPQ